MDLAAQEKHYKQKLEQMSAQHEQELFKLKQENFVLSAKVRLKLIYVQLSPKLVCDVYGLVCTVDCGRREADARDVRGGGRQAERARAAAGEGGARAGAAVGRIPTGEREDLPRAQDAAENCEGCGRSYVPREPATADRAHYTQVKITLLSYYRVIF